MARKLSQTEREIKFWVKVNQSKRCWIWTAATDNHGYGVFWDGVRLIKAHHFLTGPPPPGMDTDHLCRNRACVNPAHLEFVSRKENLARGLGNGNVLKTHCPRGHPYDPQNTYIDKRGSRRCRICYKIQAKEWHRGRQTDPSGHREGYHGL